MVEMGQTIRGVKNEILKRKQDRSRRRWKWGKGRTTIAGGGRKRGL